MNFPLLWSDYKKNAIFTLITYIANSYLYIFPAFLSRSYIFFGKNSFPLWRDDGVREAAKKSFLQGKLFNPPPHPLNGAGINKKDLFSGFSSVGNFLHLRFLQKYLKFVLLERLTPS